MLCQAECTPQQAPDFVGKTVMGEGLVPCQQTAQVIRRELLVDCFVTRNALSFPGLGNVSGTTATSSANPAGLTPVCSVPRAIPMAEALVAQ